ncbi:MAG: hypothetical protein JWR19_3805 [Pedosphaera sp.]|nr:hypothetical protein [Pedosphaera sp.]
MNITDFDVTQREALLDLLVLTMYVDGNLASVEETRVKELLLVMGLNTDFDRNRQFDASVTRVRQHSLSPDAARACASRLARNFPTREHRQEVYAILNDLTALDGSVSVEEQKYLATLREAFQM